MKTFQTFTQQLRESASPEQQRFDVLVRAGLMDKTQLPRLHRVLDKLNQDDQTFSMQERRLIFDLVKELTRLVVNDTGIFQKARLAMKKESAEDMMIEATDSSVALMTQEPPPLVVLRRKAIRMYPHSTKVALYYSDKLDRYFTVPYQDGEKPE